MPSPRSRPLLDAAAEAPARDPKAFGLWPFREVNHNVVAGWLNATLIMCADSVWSGGSVLVAYIYELMGRNNTYVGYLTMAQGIAQLVFALPLGYVADKCSKARVMWAGGCIVPIAVAATSLAAIYGVDHASAPFAQRLVAFYVILGAMMLWGIVQATYIGAGQAIYADSIATGERSRYYNILFVSGLIASSVGPLVSILISLFLHTEGNHWGLLPLRDVLLAGLGLELLGGATFFLFRDGCTLDKEAAAHAGSTRASGSGASSGTNSAANSAHGGTAAAEAAAAGDAVAAVAAAASAPCGSRHTWLIPYILFSSSLLFALGSGMTVTEPKV